MKNFFDMKKLTCLLIAVAILVSITACGSKEEASKTIRIGGLKGPTSIGMAGLFEGSSEDKTDINYEFTIAGSADELTPKLIRGELDIAAVPANLASALYNNSEGKVKLLAVNTLGVIYVLTKNENINSITDLAGKTIYASGKGSTPEYAFRYILAKNGLDPDKDINVEWKSEHEEVVQAMASSESAIGVLPQPFVTVAQGKIEGLVVALDLTREWEAVDPDSELITGVLAVNADFANKNSESIKTFLKEYKASVDWVNANPEAASELIQKADIIKKEIAAKAIPYCNIVCISGNDMKKLMSGYLNVLYSFEPKSVGGKLPPDDFYVIVD